jgi:hypothetical protein
MDLRVCKLCVCKVSRDFAFARVANSRLKDIDCVASGETAPENRSRLIVTRNVMAFFTFVTIRNHAFSRVIVQSDLR